MFKISDQIQQLITTQFDPKPIQLFKFFEYLPPPIYLFYWAILTFHLSLYIGPHGWPTKYLKNTLACLQH